MSQRRKARKAREVKVALADAVAGFRGAMTRRALLAPDLAQEDAQEQQQAEECEDAYGGQTQWKPMPYRSLCKSRRRERHDGRHHPPTPATAPCRIEQRARRP